MAKRRPVIIKAAAQMWPRLVFDMDVDEAPDVKERLKGAGVYVLFRDDQPYYVGKTKNKLFRRIQSHAVKTRGRYFHFWNYFSAFVVPNPRHRDEVEGVLIASMPTANSAVPKIKRIHLPTDVVRRMRKLRRRDLELDE